MPPNNPTGKNQHGEAKDYPPDDVLKASLVQYAREGLTRQERLDRLRAEHGLQIGLTTLKTLQKRLEIPSIYKSLPVEQQDAAILSEMSQDINHRRGVDAIKRGLAERSEPILVPRDTVRSVMRLNAVEDSVARFPGSTKGRPARKTLLSLGPNDMHHADGWEKLGALALRMGGVGLPAYGFSDQCSSKRLYFVVVPNDRLADVIVHVQLDFISVVGGIAVTHVVDKGSELGKAMDVQRRIRALVEPDIDPDIVAPVVQLSSFKNTPQEGAWHWLRNFDGHNMFDYITAERGRFNAQDDMQFCLFYWIWPPVVQASLNAFIRYWNGHKIRHQDAKANPSGTTPNQVYAVPESFGLTNYLIRVDPAIVEAFREEQTLTRDQALSFCSLSFDQAARAVHSALGSPLITKENAWQVFFLMLPVLREVYGEIVPEKAHIFTL
ncbi:hypothetical protein AURDEDRAFT_172907 [Auricularia subglabra TFB-10046 SS5]|nr:hypothetical protein AURDEDRAFT_172907 [Auricularia subglabra TFB-10046 SS5]